MPQGMWPSGLWFLGHLGGSFGGGHGLGHGLGQQPGGWM